jgi:hypothetical protein
MKRRGPAGVEEQGTFIVGSSRNLGDPVVSANGPVWRSPVNNPWLVAVASCENEAQGAAGVPPSEGNEARWEGRQEVGVLRTTGNRPEGPRGGKGAPEHGTFEGKMAETSSSTTVSTKLERIAKLGRMMPQPALTTLAHRIDIDWLPRHIGARARTEPPASTGKPLKSTRGTWMKTSSRCSSALNPAAMWRHRSEECTSRRRGMARKRGPSAYQL